MTSANENAARAFSTIRGARTLTSDLGATVGARAAGVLLALLSVLVTTRLLGVDGYGRLNYLLVLSFVVLTAALWTQAALLALGREEYEAEGTVGGSTWARASVAMPVAGLISAAIMLGWAVGIWYSDFPLRDMALVLGAAAILIVNEHLLTVLQVKGEMKRSVIMLMAQRLLLIVPLGAALVISGPGTASVTFVLAANIAAFGVVALFLLAAAGRIAVYPRRVERATVAKLAALSVPLLGASISQLVTRWQDILVIKIYRTFEEVGQYSLAYQGFQAFLEPTTAVVSVLVPLVVSMRTAGRLDLVARFFSRVVAHGSLLAGVLAGVAATPMHALVPVVFGAEFAAAADPFVVLFVALHQSLVTGLISSMFLGVGRTRAIAWAAAAVAGINLTGDFVLIPVIGILGAALSTAVGMLAGTLILTKRACALLGAEEPVWWWGLAPMGAGILPILVFPGALGYAIGPPAALCSAVAVLRLSSVVVAADKEIISALRLPTALAPAFPWLLRLSGRANG